MSTKTTYSKRPMKKDYIEVELVSGEQIKIFAIPQALVWSITPDWPRPKIPQIEVKTGTGGIEVRDAKPKDGKVYEDWKNEDVRWEEEQDKLQEAATLVLAAKEHQFPTDLFKELPQEIRMLYDVGMLHWPENPVLQRAEYLKAVVVKGQMDDFNVQMAIRKQQGIPEEVIEQMKSNFLRLLHGRTSELMEEAFDEADASGGDNENPQRGNAVEGD